MSIVKSYPAQRMKLQVGGREDDDIKELNDRYLFFLNDSIITRKQYWEASSLENKKIKGDIHDYKNALPTLSGWQNPSDDEKHGHFRSLHAPGNSGSKESIGQQDTDLHPHPYVEDMDKKVADCRKKRKAQEWGDLISGIETKEKKKTTAPTFLLREAFFLVDSSGNISEQGRPSDQFCASIVSSWVGSFPGFNLLVRAIPTMCLQTCFCGDQIYQIWLAIQ
ncbi:hypothetical protein ACJX0J_042304 [Zea mays]